MNYDSIINDNGIYLYKDNNFNTIFFKLIFEAENGNKESAILVLLSQYLNKINKKYNTVESMDLRKKELYDSLIYAETEKVGNKKFFNINADIVSFNVIGDDYSIPFYELLENTIYNPDFTNEELLDNIKRKSISSYIDELSTPSTLSGFLYQSNVFNEENNKFEHSADIEYIENMINSVTLKDLENTYQELLNNFVNGYVYGNINDEQFKLYRKYVNFSSETKSYDYTNNKIINDKDIEIVDKNANESIIYITYSINEASEEIKNILEYIFNSSCGLCLNILREKYGLCYSSGVSIDYYSNIVIFTAEIEGKNKQKFLNAVDEVINMATDKNVINKLLLLAKKNNEQADYLISNDRESMIGCLEEYILNDGLKKSDLTNDINLCTEEDIIESVKSLKKKNVFMYRGK